MAWKYDLSTTGKFLRQQINDGGEDIESCRKTLSALEKCYRLIKNKVSETEWENFANTFQNVRQHIDTLSVEDKIEQEDRLLDDGFDGMNPLLECVNSDLRDFYDLCDEYRIWVGL